METLKGVVAVIFFFLVSTLCVLQQQLVVVATATPIERVNQLAAAVKLEEACQYVPHKDFCISTLNNPPQIKIIGLAIVAINIAANNASIIRSSVLMDMFVAYKDNTKSTPEEEGVDKCLKLYDNAIGKLHKSSIPVLSSNPNYRLDYEYREVKKLVNQVIAYSNSCDQSLISNIDKTKMGTKSQVFRQLCENILAILKIMAVLD